MEKKKSFVNVFPQIVRIPARLGYSLTFTQIMDWCKLNQIDAIWKILGLMIKELGQAMKYMMNNSECYSY